MGAPTNTKSSPEKPSMSNAVTESRGVVTKVDPNADRVLMKRFADLFPFPLSHTKYLLGKSNGISKHFWVCDL